LLKLANSGISDVPVHDLDYAVVQLGVDPLRAFILSVPVLPSDGPLPVLGLWDHAVRCGEVCAWLARKSQYEHQNRAYIAGLLHDLGRFPLIAWQLATHRGELTQPMKLVSATPEQEDETFGINHQVIGGWMAVTWNLPDFLVEVLERHHPRSLPSDSLLVQLVQAADCFCNRGCSHVSQVELLESLAPFTSPGNKQRLFAQLCEAFPAVADRANNHYLYECKDV
jgi:HD-like signal output (HDOD) protein